MFLSTINRLREEQEKDNSLKVLGRGNAAKPKILNIGGEIEGKGSIDKEGNKCVSRTSKKFNGGKNKANGFKNDNELKLLNNSQMKRPNKVLNVSKENKISSFQQILNIAMTSGNGVRSLDQKSTLNRKAPPNRFIPPSSYYDSFPGSPNSDCKSDDQISQEENSETPRNTEDEGDSPPKINFVRIICTGKESDDAINAVNKTNSSKKSDKKKDKENNNNAKSIKRLKSSDSNKNTDPKSTPKPSRIKEITKKDDGQTGKLSGQILNNSEESKSKDKNKYKDKGQNEESFGKRKATEVKAKKQKTTTQKDTEEESRSSNSKNTKLDSEEKPEIYKQNILTLKAKNNLIKKRLKEKTDDDFFSNILISTPTYSSSRKNRKSLNLEQSPNLSIFSPDTLDVRLLKTGLTPVASNEEEFLSGASNNKASKRKELRKKKLESFHLSPLSSCLKEIASGEDTNRNSSYSKTSASKSLGDILGGLESTTGSKAGKLGKLNCEKQNKFVMQIHEKLTNENFNDENKQGNDPNSQGKKAGITTDKPKVTKGSLDLKMNLDSALDQEMEINTKISDQEKQQELLWSITEDLSVQNEDRNLLIEEFIAHTTHQPD